MSKTAKGAPILARLATEGERLVPRVRECMVRRQDPAGGAWRRGWAELEDRFPQVVEMADKMPGTSVVGLVEELFDEMARGWESRGPGFEGEPG